MYTTLMHTIFGIEDIVFGIGKLVVAKNQMQFIRTHTWNENGCNRILKNGEKVRFLQQRQNRH